MRQRIRDWVRNHRVVTALGSLAALIVVISVLVWAVASRGDGDGQVSPAGDDLVSQGALGGVAVSEAWITQDDERKDIVLDNPLARLFEAGPAVLTVSFTGSVDDVKIGGQALTKQDGSYQADVTLEDGVALGNESNKILVEWNGGSRELELWAFAHAGSQSVVPEVVETSAEMMVNLRVDPVFQEAFGRFCSFAPEEVDAVELRLNDRPRFQVAFVNGEFQESRGVIMPGQPIWVLVSKSGEECFINPPCGNPEVDRGKLPLAPPVEEVMLPIPTPPVGPTPPPPATPTPPPGATPTPTPPTVTPTPTPTPTPPTRTPTPTPTPVPPACNLTIIGPHRVDNTQMHARMQASFHWYVRPNFTPSVQWFLDGSKVGGGEAVSFMASLNVQHTLSVVVLHRNQVVCTDIANFAEGSIPPGSDIPGTDPLPTHTPIPAPTPGSDPDDGYQGP